MTLIELVDATARQLDAAAVCFGHGTGNAFDEAAWLVLWRLGLPLDSALLADQALASSVPTAQQREEVAVLLSRRIGTRKPLAYLTREAWLQGVSFYVDERVIVPRSLIAEVLCNGTIAPWLEGDEPRILDLCTGGASLAVLAALNYPDSAVDAADISPDALAVAAINVARHDLGRRITLIASDGLSALPGPYDLIVCNPPYVNADSMARLPPEYQAEPALALDGNRLGGDDGMDFIRQLLRETPRHLSEQGVLVLEIGNERAHFEAAFGQIDAIWLETSAGADQVLLLERGALLKC